MPCTFCVFWCCCCSFVHTPVFIRYVSRERESSSMCLKIKWFFVFSVCIYYMAELMRIHISYIGVVAILMSFADADTIAIGERLVCVRVNMCERLNGERVWVCKTLPKWIQSLACFCAFCLLLYYLFSVSFTLWQCLIFSLTRTLHTIIYFLRFGSIQYTSKLYGNETEEEQKTKVLTLHNIIMNA